MQFRQAVRRTYGNQLSKCLSYKKITFIKTINQNIENIEKKYYAINI